MDFAAVITLHGERYNNMEPQDWGKLAFQSEFGPEHLVVDEAQVLRGILDGLARMGDSCVPEGPEPVGNGLCRFPLSALRGERDAALLAKLFVRSAQEHQGSREGLLGRLGQLKEAGIPGMAEWVEGYLAQDCPAVGHSDSFRAACHPHYRLLKREYALYFPVLREMEDLLAEGGGVLAIDGRCGSGKSSLGGLLAGLYPCTLVHMDDFYMPPEGRQENWMEIPAGNMDLERFEREVLRPAASGEQILYRPYLCRTGELSEGTVLPDSRLTVVEGSYSHHPALAGYYDRKVFLTCEKEEQLERLQRREGDYFPRFLNIWIPLEEQYFRAFGIEEGAHLRVDTGSVL